MKEPKPKSTLPDGSMNPAYRKWYKAGGHKLVKKYKVQPSRKETCGIPQDDRWMMGLSIDVNRACTKWLRDRGLEAEPYGPILANLKSRGLR
jgi:hypothetical protein